MTNEHMDTGNGATLDTTSAYQVATAVLVCRDSGISYEHATSTIAGRRLVKLAYQTCQRAFGQTLFPPRRIVNKTEVWDAACYVADSIMIRARDTWGAEVAAIVDQYWTDYHASLDDEPVRIERAQSDRSVAADLLASEPMGVAGSESQESIGAQLLSRLATMSRGERASLVARAQSQGVPPDLRELNTPGVALCLAAARLYLDDHGCFAEVVA